MTFDFGNVLTRAWQITWKYKVLWIFGILASCSRGGGGSGGGGGNGYENNGNGNNPFGPEVERYFSQAGQWLTENWWIVAVVLLALLIIVILSVFLGTVGRIGLIRGTLQAEAGAERLDFGELFSGSMPYFWRVFGLTFLIGLVFLVAFLPLIAFGALTAGVGFLCLLPFICLLIPVSIALYLVIELANVAIVKENMGIVDAFKQGWQLLRTQFGPVFVMGLILFVISFAIGLVIAIPLIAIVVPAAFGLSGIGGPNPSLLMIAGICFAVFLPFAIIVNGIFNTYMGAAWTLTYNRLTAKPEPAAVPAEANA